MNAAMNENSLLNGVLPATTPEPLLFSRRRYLEEIPADASTTSCQTTSNPSDYSPDD